VQVWRGHEGTIRRLAVAPDGELIASAGDDRTVRLWDVQRGEATILRGHQAGVLYVGFAPDGKQLVSTGGDGTTRLWKVERPAALEPLRPWLDATTSVPPAE
jgi:WD40 repeat protein